jgi:hypothetical protein
VVAKNLCLSAGIVPDKGYILSIRQRC